jgi:hypothetical protein
MTKEDIEKAAGDYSGSSLGFTENNSVMAKHKAFADGANWRINSVWHDASEKPRRNKWYIAQIGDNAFDTFTDSVNWKSYARSLNIIRWAYIEDLIPSKEE